MRCPLRSNPSIEGTSNIRLRLLSAAPQVKRFRRHFIGSAGMDVVVRRLFVTILIVGAPLLLAAVELFHPHPDDLLRLDIKGWLIVHYAQILLFPLSAVATVLLVRGREDMWAILCRIAMFIFAASYVAFDTAAGVVTGILVNAAQTSGMPEAWRAPIDAVWTHPVVGGSPLVPAPLLAVLGSVALSVGAIAAAVSLRRAGNSWAPVFPAAQSTPRARARK